MKKWNILLHSRKRFYRFSHVLEKKNKNTIDTQDNLLVLSSIILWLCYKYRLMGSTNACIEYQSPVDSWVRANLLHNTMAGNALDLPSKLTFRSAFSWTKTQISYKLVAMRDIFDDKLHSSNKTGTNGNFLVSGWCKFCYSRFSAGN